jgi:hypothetical protein
MENAPRTPATRLTGKSISTEGSIRGIRAVTCAFSRVLEPEEPAQDSLGTATRLTRAACGSGTLRKPNATGKEHFG